MCSELVSDGREICSKKGTSAPAPSSALMGFVARALTAWNATWRTCGETTTTGTRERLLCATFFTTFLATGFLVVFLTGVVGGVVAAIAVANNSGSRKAS